MNITTPQNVNIIKTAKNVKIELSPEVYDMLIIEAKFLMHNNCFGKNAQEQQKFITKNKVLSNFALLPLYNEMPTSY